MRSLWGGGNGDPLLTERQAPSPRRGDPQDWTCASPETKVPQQSSLLWVRDCPNGFLGWGTSQSLEWACGPCNSPSIASRSTVASCCSQSLSFLETDWLLMLGDAGLADKDLSSGSGFATPCVQRRASRVPPQELTHPVVALLTAGSLIFIVSDPSWTESSYRHQRAPGCSSPRRLSGSVPASCSGKHGTHLAAAVQRQAGGSERKRGHVETFICRLLRHPPEADITFDQGGMGLYIRDCLAHGESVRSIFAFSQGKAQTWCCLIKTPKEQAVESKPPNWCSCLVIYWPVWPEITWPC